MIRINNLMLVIFSAVKCMWQLEAKFDLRRMLGKSEFRKLLKAPSVLPTEVRIMLRACGKG